MTNNLFEFIHCKHKELINERIAYHEHLYAMKVLDHKQYERADKQERLRLFGSLFAAFLGCLGLGFCVGAISLGSALLQAGVIK